MMVRPEQSDLEKSYFWGATLDDKHKEFKWDGEATENTTDCSMVSHTLMIRQAVLGPDANEEVNVVEIECRGKDRKYKLPICVFKAGSQNVCHCEVVVEDQTAVLRLIKGCGPIHLSGTHQTHTTVVDEIDDTMGEDEDIEEEEELEDEDAVIEPAKKKSKK